MKRHDSEHDRAGRYFRALVAASLTARRPTARSAADRIDDSPAQHERWRAQPALWLDIERQSSVRGS